MNIYVANLGYNVTEDQLRSLFEQFGSVDSAKIILDRETNRSRGFGFVEMPDEDEAKSAIANLNDSEFNGQNLMVNEARERKPRFQGGGGNFQNRPFRPRGNNQGGGGFSRGGNRGGERNFNSDRKFGRSDYNR